MAKSPYREHILDHYRNPRHRGQLENPSQLGEADNPVCGDRVRLELALDETGIVTAAAFRGDGCIICLATASMMAEYVHGRHVEELETLEEEDVLAMLGVELGRARTQCALVSLKALKAALQREG